MVSFGGGGGGTAGYLTERRTPRPGAGERRGSDRRSVRGPGRGRLPGVRAPEHHRRDRLGAGGQPDGWAIREVLQEFEKTAWAGLEPDRYAWSAVQHRDAKGGVHVHVFAARVDLETGKSLNIAPPGWEKTFGTLRDWQNCKRGWSRPGRSGAGAGPAAGLSRLPGSQREARRPRPTERPPEDHHRLRGRPHRERERHGSRLPGGRTWRKGNPFRNVRCFVKPIEKITRRNHAGSRPFSGATGRAKIKAKKYFRSPSARLISFEQL